MKPPKSTSLLKDFFRAIEQDNIQSAKGLIDSGCDINSRDRGGSTALMRAALNGYDDLVALLLRMDADVNLHDNIGKTALHYASQEHHEVVARMLLKAGAAPNSEDIHGNTPLSDATFYSHGRGSLIKLLRESGADDHKANKHGVTPLSLAKSISNYDVIQHFKGYDPRT